MTQRQGQTIWPYIQGWDNLIGAQGALDPTENIPLRLQGLCQKTFLTQTEENKNRSKVDVRCLPWQ